MLIPVAMCHFDEPDAGLGEAACHQALAAEIICAAGPDAVRLKRGLFLAFHAHHLGQRALHTEGELVALDDTIDLCARLVALLEVAVQRLDVVELATLFLSTETVVAEIRDTNVLQ